MDIKEASHILGITERHIRRLIRGGQLPAQKVRMKKVTEVEVDVWDIDNDAVQAARNSFADLSKYDHFGIWMIETAGKLGLNLRKISKRTRIPLATLVEIAKTPGHLSGLNADIETKIGDLLMRVDIERRYRKSSIP